MSYINKRCKERVIQLGQSSGGRYHAQLIHYYGRNSLQLRIWDSSDGKEYMFFDIPASSGELFAAYRAIAEVTKGELERLNNEFSGGAE